MGIDAVGGRHHDAGLREDATPAAAGFDRHPLHVIGVGELDAVELGISFVEVGEVGIDKSADGEVVAEDFGDEELGFRGDSGEVFIGPPEEAGIGHDVREMPEVEPLSGERFEKVFDSVVCEEAASLFFKNDWVRELASFGEFSEGVVGRGAVEEVGEACGEVVVIERACAVSAVEEIRRAEGGAEREVYSVFEAAPVSLMGEGDVDILFHLVIGGGTAEGFVEKRAEDGFGIFPVRAILSLAHEAGGNVFLGFLVFVFDEAKGADDGHAMDIDGGPGGEAKAGHGLDQVHRLACHLCRELRDLGRFGIEGIDIEAAFLSDGLDSFKPVPAAIGALVPRFHPGGTEFGVLAEHIDQLLGDPFFISGVLVAAQGGVFVVNDYRFALLKFDLCLVGFGFWIGQFELREERQFVGPGETISLCGSREEVDDGGMIWAWFKSGEIDFDPINTGHFCFETVWPNGTTCERIA